MSSASSAIRLPAGLARAAVVTAAPAQWVPTGGRHSAPEPHEVVRALADEVDNRRARPAEPEWSRAVFDALRDEDPLDWLGFSAAG
jgi:hypothetical protein